MKINKILLTITFLFTFGCNTGPDIDTLLTGNWEYRQGNDKEGEILHLSKEGESWLGVMNGLERAEDHGLFYYVAKVDDLVIKSDGIVSFKVGKRDFHQTRPTLNDISVTFSGDGGASKVPIYFNGKFENNYLVLECKDRVGSCPDHTLRFKKKIN